MKPTTAARAARRRDDLTFAIHHGDDARAAELLGVGGPAATASPVLFPAAGGEGPHPLTGGPDSQRPLFSDPIRRLHHLRVSFPVARGELPTGDELTANLDAVRELVSLALKIQGQERLAKTLGRRAGLWTYDNGTVWHDAEDRELAGLFWSEGRGEACLDVRGGGCDRIDPAQQLALIRALAELGARGVRVDLAWDDYDRLATLDTIEQAARANNLTGFKKFLRLAPVKDARTLEKDGDSMVFGARGSDGSGKYLRIYDKFLESGKDPNFDCLRWEAELTDGYAHAAFLELSTCGETRVFQQKIGELLGGVVDFIDRAAGDKNLARCPRLDWFSAVLRRMCAALTTTMKNPKPAAGPLARALQALRKQYGRRLALARVVLQSAGVALSAVVDHWCDQAEQKVNWDQEGQKELALRLPALLAT